MGFWEELANIVSPEEDEEEKKKKAKQRQATLEKVFSGNVVSKQKSRYDQAIEDAQK